MKRTLRILSICFVIMFSFVTSSLAESSADLHNNIRSLLCMAMEDSYYYNITGNDSGYIIRIADEGLSESVLYTAMGIKPRSDWQSYIDSTIAYANSISNFIKECGVENPNLLFIVVDEYEMNVPLLAIFNGEVVYDYAPE